MSPRSIRVIATLDTTTHKEHIVLTGKSREEYIKNTSQKKFVLTQSAGYRFGAFIKECWELQSHTKLDIF